MVHQEKKDQLVLLEFKEKKEFREVLVLLAIKGQMVRLVTKAHWVHLDHMAIKD
jgi:hypothetical protein